jgi:hypothetical protein
MVLSGTDDRPGPGRNIVRNLYKKVIRNKFEHTLRENNRCQFCGSTPSAQHTGRKQRNKSAQTAGELGKPAK